MSLQEQIQSDIDIFFDVEDMATEHCINGRKVCVVIDNDLGELKSLKSSDGTYSGDLLFFAKSIDLQGISARDSLIFDDVPFFVASVVEMDGVIQVALNSQMGGYG